MKLFPVCIQAELVIVVSWVFFMLSAVLDREKERELVRRAQNGDSRAFEQLVIHFQKPVYDLAYRIVLNHMDADEVVQNTFLKAYQHLDDFSDEYKLFTWLYRIATNQSLSLLKKRNKKVSSFDTLKDEDGVQFASDKNVFQEYRDSELEDIVSKALENIKPELRAVFTLKVWGGLSYKEISDALGISEGTVMSRLNRVRGKLQAVLKKTGGYR